MQEEIENKTLSLIINTSKFTERTLATAFAKALKLGWNKAKEHHQAKPQGRQSVKQLIGQNQGVEQTALADRQEVKAFERYARQYGVDYAIHKGTSDSGKTRYLVFFKARDRAAIDQAMRAYAMDFLAKRKAQRNVQPQLDTASPSKQKERSRQKTPFITSVSIETTPPETASVPICVTICRSKIGLSSPTAHTSGSTSRSF